MKVEEEVVVTAAAAERATPAPLAVVPSPTAAAPLLIRTKSATDTLHFIVLQHGYHGGSMDMQYLADCLIAGAASHTYVLHNVLPHHESEYGIQFGAGRLTQFVLKEVRRVVLVQRAVNAQLRRAAASGDAPSTLHLHFSFVGHSMGGLIIRAALPALTAALEEREPLAPVALHWDTLCFISVPLVGTAHMPSRRRAAVGYSLGRFSKSLADLFLRSPLLTDELLTPAYLSPLRAFEQRVILRACNDHTVMSYTAALHIPAEEQALLTGAAGGYPDTLDPAPREAQGLPPPGTSSTTMAASRWTLKELNEKLWPPELLPRERALADTLLAGGLSPVDVHTVDLRPAAAAATHLPGRLWRRLWAHKVAHHAILCNPPCNFPSAFGFVSEYICTDVFHIPFVEERVRLFTQLN